MNPWELSAGQRAVLLANMKSLEAEEVLRDKGGDLTPESLGKLVELITGDEDAGQRAAARRVLELERARAANGGTFGN